MTQHVQQNLRRPRVKRQTWRAARAWLLALTWAAALAAAYGYGAWIYQTT